MSRVSQVDRERIRAKVHKHCGQMHVAAQECRDELLRVVGQLEETFGDRMPSGYLDALRSHAADLSEDSLAASSVLQGWADLLADPRLDPPPEVQIIRQWPSPAWAVAFAIVWCLGAISGILLSVWLR